MPHTPLRTKVECTECACLYARPRRFYRDLAEELARLDHLYYTGSDDPGTNFDGTRALYPRERSYHHALTASPKRPCPACVAAAFEPHIETMESLAPAPESSALTDAIIRDREDALTEVSLSLADAKYEGVKPRERAAYATVAAARKSVRRSAARAATAAARGAEVRAAGVGEDGRAPTNWRLGLKTGDRFDCLTCGVTRLTYFRGIHHSCADCEYDAGRWKPSSERNPAPEPGMRKCEGCGDLFEPATHRGRPPKWCAQCAGRKKRDSQKRWREARVKASPVGATTAIANMAPGVLECVEDVLYTTGTQGPGGQGGSTTRLTAYRLLNLDIEASDLVDDLGAPVADEVGAVVTDAVARGRAMQEAAEADILARRDAGSREPVGLLRGTRHAGLAATVVERMCAECGHLFTVERRRGRYPSRCGKCSGAVSDSVVE